jgi:hypothetical protein
MAQTDSLPVVVLSAQVSSWGLVELLPQVVLPLCC